MKQKKHRRDAPISGRLRVEPFELPAARYDRLVVDGDGVTFISSPGHPAQMAERPKAGPMGPLRQA